MPQLHCLVYTSIMNPFCDELAIQDILHTAKQTNEQLSITGILVHTHRHFMQYIEGPGKNITSLFNKIKRDPRHQDVILCHFFPIEQRLFPSWEMAYKDLKKKELSILDRLNKREQTIYKDFVQDRFHNTCYEDQKDLLAVLKIFL